MDEPTYYNRRTAVYNKALSNNNNNQIPPLGRRPCVA